MDYHIKGTNSLSDKITIPRIGISESLIIIVQHKEVFKPALLRQIKACVPGVRRSPAVLKVVTRIHQRSVIQLIENQNHVYPVVLPVLVNRLVLIVANNEQWAGIAAPL
jgi:hypothetical protein